MKDLKASLIGALYVAYFVFVCLPLLLPFRMISSLGRMAGGIADWLGNRLLGFANFYSED